MEASGSTVRLPPTARLRPLSQAGLLAARPQVIRRNSTNLTPRPLRSSPLAGPALSYGDEGQGVALEDTRPQVIASAPASRSPSPLSFHSLDFAAETSSLPPSSFRSHGQSKVSFAVPAIHPSLDGASKRPGNRRSVSQPISILSVPDSRMETLGHDRPPNLTSDHPTPTLPPTRPGSRVSLHDPSENWLTYTPYDATPRFSRLGLAAPGVVMPVRKKGGRPKSADSASERSSVSLPSLSSSASSRTSSLKRPSTPKLLRMQENAEVYVAVVEKSRKAEADWDGDDSQKEQDTILRKDVTKRGGTIRRLWRRLSPKSR
ncbi:hypothetical protein C8R43DRAFT_510872 [Mycena crocata]|nr:hypothetical protein C8R43DRAFT_510872 [Mycena crocata]